MKCQLQKSRFETFYQMGRHYAYLIMLIFQVLIILDGYIVLQKHFRKIDLYFRQKKNFIRLIP